MTSSDAWGPRRIGTESLAGLGLIPAAQHALAMARVQSREHLLLVRPCTIARLGAPEVRSNIRHVIAELRSAPTQPRRRSRSRSPPRDGRASCRGMVLPLAHPGRTFDDQVNLDRHLLGLSWVEMVAAERPLSAHAVAQALAEVFTESDMKNSSVEWRRMQGRRWTEETVIAGVTVKKVEFFTFEEKCLASGCGHLIAPVVLNKSCDLAVRRWKGGPQVRVRLGLSEVTNSRPPTWSNAQAVRTPGALAREAGVRLMTQSIKGSWESYASELRTWGLFMDSYDPSAPHFPPTVDMVIAFCAYFQNGSSLQKYFGALRFACRWQNIAVDQRVWEIAAAAVRGVRKVSMPAKRPAIRSTDLIQLVDMAVRDHDVEDAQLYIVSYIFLGRVVNEILPLRRSGRHSNIAFRGRRAVVALRSRKNSPNGEEITRRCSCEVAPDAPCGVCALRALVRAAALSNRPLDAPIFWRKSVSKRTKDLVRRCRAIGLGKVGWHSFRRGRAQDMLASGATLAQILTAGGWRSSAFLSYLRRRDVDERNSLETVMNQSDSDRE